MNSIDEASDRSLDALVARHVFGFLVEPTAGFRAREREVKCRLPAGGWIRVPYYSSMVLGADVVLKRLRNLGWRVNGEPRADLNGAAGKVEIMLGHVDGRIVSALGQSFGEALCRAALKAVGQ